MYIKYLLLRDIQNIVVFSPHQRDYEKCKYYKIKGHRSLDRLLDITNRKVYISCDFKKKYDDSFSYLRWNIEVIFFEGPLK